MVGGRLVLPVNNLPGTDFAPTLTIATCCDGRWLQSTGGIAGATNDSRSVGGGATNDSRADEHDGRSVNRLGVMV